MNCKALILLLLPLAILSAQELPTVDEVINSFEAAGKDLKSFKASFIRKETDEFGDINTKEGHIYFLAPGRYLLVTMLDGKPLEELGKNNEHGWRTRHHVKTVDHVDVQSDAEVGGGYAFSDADDLRNSFEWTMKGKVELDSGPAWHLHGVPKDPESKLEFFEVWINVANPSPLVKLMAKDQRTTETITFHSVERNISIDADIFEYNPPAGYEIHER